MVQCQYLLGEKEKYINVLPVYLSVFTKLQTQWVVGDNTTGGVRLHLLTFNPIIELTLLVDLMLQLKVVLYMIKSQNLLRKN